MKRKYMNKKIIYFACHYSSLSHPWYSSGGNTKVLQTLNILKKISDELVFVNFTPQEKFKIIPNTINICKSFNKLIYCCEILLSFLTHKAILSNNENKTLLVYNPRFTALLFFISAILFCSKPKLIIQIEDMPGARKSSFPLLDKISFRILSKYAKHIFFASKGMMKIFKENNPNKLNISIYPPCLPKKYIEVIKNRKSPFSKKYLNIMYAGGFSKEKGVYDLIEAFEKANLKESKLNIYGYFPDDIKEKYKYNKSILFHGFVTQEELFNSYANNDIVVNPHKLILNNNYIFPYKNIEIFSSGAFPLVSKESILGLNSLKIRKLCTFKNLNQLKNKLKNAEKLWKENINIFQDSQKLFIKNYSEEKILYDVRRVFEN